MYRWKNQDPALTLATAEELEYYRFIGKYDLVLEIVLKVTYLCPNDFHAHYHLAVAYSDTQKYELAVEMYDKSLTLHGGHANAYNIHRYKAQALSKLEKYEEAIQSCEKSIPLIETMHIERPRAARLYDQICDDYIQLKQFENAHTAIDKAIEMSDEAIYHNRKGNIYYKQRLYAQSHECYTIAILADPANSTFCRNRGNVLADMGKLEDALLDYGESNRIEPNGDTFCFMGDALDVYGRWEEAIIAYDEAIKLDPYESTYHNNKGFTLNKMERYDEAIQVLDKTMELSPQVANSYCHKGYAYFKKGQFDIALGLYNKALELNPQYQLAIERRAVLLEIK